MRRSLLGALTISTLVTSTILAAPANGYACDADGGFPYRARDKAYGVTDAEGVTSRIITPNIGDVSSAHPDTAGDIYLYYSIDFVQMGWYIGSAPGLPYTASPRVYYGERVPGTDHTEKLRPGPIVGWGANFKYTIKRGIGPIYSFYLDGEFLATTVYSHSENMRPGSVGETNLACNRMYHRATSGGSPIVPTIYYTANGTAWSKIIDSYEIQTRNGVSFVSTRAGSDASHFAYGGGS